MTKTDACVIMTSIVMLIAAIATIACYGCKQVEETEREAVKAGWVPKHLQMRLGNQVDQLRRQEEIP